MAITIRIDQAGRLVVPQALRRRLGLTAGARLRVWEEAGRLLLEPIPEQPILVEEGGLLLAGGYLEGAEVDHRALREERLARRIEDVTE